MSKRLPCLTGLSLPWGRPLTLDDMEVMSWALYQSGQKIPANLILRYSINGINTVIAWLSFMKSMILFLTPTTAEVAPKHDQFQLSATLENKLKHIADFDRNCQQKLIWEMFADSLAWTPFYTAGQSNRTARHLYRFIEISRVCHLVFN